MIQRLGTQTAAILIIFMSFLALLILLATIGKLVFYWRARRLKTSFSARETLTFFLRADEVVQERKCQLSSSFYAYHPSKKTFWWSSRFLKQENLHANLLIIQAIIYAEEQNHQRPTRYRLQYFGLTCLNAFLFCLLITMLLLALLPSVDVNQKVDLAYWISVEALSIIGWVVMLIIIFWWINLTMEFNETIQEKVDEMHHQRLSNEFKNYLNLLAYFPFSFRTII